MRQWGSNFRSINLLKLTLMKYVNHTVPMDKPGHSSTALGVQINTELVDGEEEETKGEE